MVRRKDDAGGVGGRSAHPDIVLRIDSGHSGCRLQMPAIADFTCPPGAAEFMGRARLLRSRDRGMIGGLRLGCLALPTCGRSSTPTLEPVRSIHPRQTGLRRVSFHEPYQSGFRPTCRARSGIINGSFEFTTTIQRRGLKPVLHRRGSCRDSRNGWSALGLLLCE